MKSSPAHFLLVFLIAALPFASFASTIPTSVKPAEQTAASPSPLAGMTVKDFLALTPKSYKALTGKKMGLKEKVALKLAQRKMKKEVRNHPDMDINAPLPAASIFDTSDFNPWALVLGLVPVVGILIAYLTDDNTIIKWAWVGTGIVVLILLLFLIF